MNDNLKQLLESIVPADKTVAEDARIRLDSLIKPAGSLGALEDCAVRYAAARGTLFAAIEKPVVLTFAGDHGVAAERVSMVPSELTLQMFGAMSAGLAGINVLSRHAGAELKLIDVGIAADCAFPNVLKRKVARGTKNIANGPAMSEMECLMALNVGMEEAFESIEKGSTILMTGEMGIANTTPSAALYCSYLNLEPEAACGCGTGVEGTLLKHKIEVVKKALKSNELLTALGPFETLCALGGLEIAAICGMILASASRRVPVIVDGYISSAAALSAIRLNPHVMDYCFFSHLSGDKGHAEAMRALGVKPLLDLGMRLGEGTGAVLALNLLQAATKIIKEMGTFEEAGIALV